MGSHAQRAVAPVEDHKLRPEENVTQDLKAGGGALNAAKTGLQQAEADYSKAVAALSDAQTAHQWKAGVQLPTSAAPTDPAALPAWLLANEAKPASWADAEASWRGESKFRTQLKAAADRYDTNAARVVLNHDRGFGHRYAPRLDLGERGDAVG